MKNHGKRIVISVLVLSGLGGILPGCGTLLEYWYFVGIIPKNELITIAGKLERISTRAEQLPEPYLEIMPLCSSKQFFTYTGTPDALDPTPERCRLMAEVDEMGARIEVWQAKIEALQLGEERSRLELELDSAAISYVGAYIDVEGERLATNKITPRSPYDSETSNGLFLFFSGWLCLVEIDLIESGQHPERMQMLVEQGRKLGILSPLPDRAGDRPQWMIKYEEDQIRRCLDAGANLESWSCTLPERRHLESVGGSILPEQVGDRPARIILWEADRICQRVMDQYPSRR